MRVVKHHFIIHYMIYFTYLQIMQMLAYNKINELLLFDFFCLCQYIFNKYSIALSRIIHENVRNSAYELTLLKYRATAQVMSIWNNN